MRPVIKLLFACVLVFGATAIRAEEALAAVAANFSDVAQELAPLFQQRTGHRIKFSYGASGKFATQIEHGAPFELLLSADAERPLALEQKGLGVAGSRFTYARGALALWSASPGYVDAKGAVLKRNEFARLALANPKTAPYGVAAVETLQRMGMWEAVKGKVVLGESISQAFQFVDTGNAAVGFVALAQVMALPVERRGSWWQVPASFHSPIEQQAILLKRGADNPAARAFLEFLRSDQARQVIRRYGYRI